MIRFLILFALALNAHAASVVINNQHDLIIDGAYYTSTTGDCLTISNSTNVVVRNSDFINCYGVGAYIYNSSNVRVRASFFENVNGGMYAVLSNTVKAVNNRFKNISRTGHMDDARGQFVQFDTVTGTGNLIERNIGINEPGISDPEDAVNLYNSSGTAASPIMVQDNCFKGGGPSDSGGGIMAGDSGGSNQVVQNNTLVDVGQYGIGLAGGTNIKALNNWIYGQQQPFTNVGMYVWNQSGGACSNITVHGNHIDYENSDGYQNPYWNAENCGTVVGESFNYFGEQFPAIDCTL